MIVKANYVKRGEGDRARAKATIRYITHRRDREGERVTRDLFGFEGFLDKQTAYRLIDEAPQKGRDTVGQPPSKFEEYFFLGEFPQLFCLQRRHLGHTNLAT